MAESITVRGFIGNDVRTHQTREGVPIATFRLASTPRRFDRDSGSWVNGATNWFTVSAFRTLAQNASSSLRKGDPVVVTGRLKIRQWEGQNGERGTGVDIDAEGIGHDLSLGTSAFTRLSVPSTESEGPTSEGVDAGGDESQAQDAGADWGEPSPSPAF